MTSSNFYIWAHSVGPGNFSGCDKCLHVCLPKSNANFTFCGFLTLFCWIAAPPAHYVKVTVPTRKWQEIECRGEHPKPQSTRSLAWRPEKNHLILRASSSLYCRVEWAPWFYRQTVTTFPATQGIMPTAPGECTGLVSLFCYGMGRLEEGEQIFKNTETCYLRKLSMGLVIC